jgi:hypothetical protein
MVLTAAVTVTLLLGTEPIGRTNPQTAAQAMAIAFWMALLASKPFA